MEKDHIGARSIPFTRLGFVLALLLPAIILPPSALAQKDTGGIAGVVRDSAGGRK